MDWKSAASVIVGTLFVFAVCNTRAAYAAPPTDACALLTSAQVSAALGVPVTAGKYLLPNDTKDCGWPPSAGLPPPKRVFLEIGDPSHWGYMKMQLPIKSVVKTPVSGIGDDAVYVTTSGIGTALYVKKGNFVFQIRVYGFAVEQTKAKEKTLALDVLQKLTNGREEGGDEQL